MLHFAEQLHHFFARLEIERGLLEAHPVGVRHGLAGLDAQHDFVRARVVLAQVMRIVGGDQRNAGVGRQAIDQRQHALIGFQAVILQFEEEILRAEQVGVFVRDAARVFVAIGQQCFVDIAAQARRQRDQTLGMPRQQILIDARLVVETVQIAGRDQLDQVAITLLVFAQQHQVVVTVAFRSCPLWPCWAT